MRHAVVLSAVLLAAPILPGQEESLPPVMPRAESPVYVALAVEPVRATATVSLEDAARANDYPTFHALYEQTRSPAYAPLHELWTYSVNDPIGAFYGPEMYERFARLYPDFAAYIEDHKIVDDRGNVFYPTSETRAFLLAKAVEGTVVNTEEPPQLAKTESQRRSGYSPTRKTPRVLMRKSEAVAPDPEVGLKPEAGGATAASAVVASAVVSPAPEAGAAPLVATPALEAGAAPPVVRASALPVVPRAQPQNDLAGRGILLIMVGLVGSGFLALILRTPREQIPPPPPSPAQDLRKAPR